MQKNTNQNNSEYGHFLRRDDHKFVQNPIPAITYQTFFLPQFMLLKSSSFLIKKDISVSALKDNLNKPSNKCSNIEMIYKLQSIWIHVKKRNKLFSGGKFCLNSQITC